jgi:TolA-binding protein
MQQLRFAQPTGRAFCGRGGFLPAAVPHPRPPAALQPSGWRAAVAAPLPERRPAASPAATAADTLQQQQTQEAQCGDGETYGRALELARVGDYVAARVSFSEALACQPRLCKAWVSWAQARFWNSAAARRAQPPPPTACPYAAAVRRHPPPLTASHHRSLPLK